MNTLKKIRLYGLIFVLIFLCVSCGINNTNQPEKHHQNTIVAENVDLNDENQTENPDNLSSESLIIPEEKLFDENKSQDISAEDVFIEPVNEQAKTEDTSSSKDTPLQTEDGVLICSLSIRCNTILDNIEKLDSIKIDLVPSDGKIFENFNAVAYEGESVFNLLSRELRKNKIHFEFTKNPTYNSIYIEGIGNLYERDCGELSGWMYKVNDEIPEFGCSQYSLKNGDKVEFLYSCDMGNDI